MGNNRYRIFYGFKFVAHVSALKNFLIFDEQNQRVDSFWLETPMDPDGILDESSFDTLTMATTSAYADENERKFVKT